MPNDDRRGARSASSAPAAKLASTPRRTTPLDEEHFREIDAVMLYLEDARARTERAADALRKSGGEPHLIEALERTERELSAVARALRQGTLFAVPAAQTSL